MNNRKVGHCYRWAAISVIKTDENQDEEGKNLFHLTGYDSSSKEVYRARTWTRFHREACLLVWPSGLLGYSSSSPASATQGGKGLPTSLAIMKLDHRSGHMSVSSRQFLNWSSFFPGDFSLYQLDNYINHASHVVSTFCLGKWWSISQTEWSTFKLPCCSELCIL